MELTYWASYDGNTVGPYKTREEAREAFFANFAEGTTCIVGYGKSGPHFDRRFEFRYAV